MNHLVKSLLVRDWIYEKYKVLTKHTTICFRGYYKIKELINFENMNLKAEPEIDENGFKNVYQKSLLS